MSKIDKIKNFSLLFDLYKGLLTDIQKDVFQQYYLEDYSFSEIAKNTNTSRASVSDKLKRIEKKLSNLEDKLHFVEKTEKINEIVSILETNGNTSLAKKIKEIL